MAPGGDERQRRAAIAEVTRELRTLHLERADSAIDAVLPTIRRLLGFDNVVITTPVQGVASLRLERFHADNLPGAELVRDRFATLFQATTRRYAWYDPISPEPAQRNRVVEATDLVSREDFERSVVYRDVLEPSGLHHRRQPRMLLCEGPSLLAWFGTFHGERATPRQRRLMRRIAIPLRERLAVERRLQHAPGDRAALAAALEALGAPAFVVGPAGQHLETNPAGRALLDLDPALRGALLDAIAGRPSTHAFELVPLRDRGVPDAWLAILRATSPAQRMRAALEHARQRWELTARQFEVLAQSVDGHAVVTIAQLLGITARAVELHLTALFDKAGVESRAALAAAVLRGP